MIDNSLYSCGSGCVGGYDSLFELYLEQKFPWFDGMVSILVDPPAKLKQLIITQLLILTLLTIKVPTNALAMRQLAQKM
jgi:hypothetical protein